MTPNEPWDGDSDLDALLDYRLATAVHDLVTSDPPVDEDVELPVVQVVNPPGTVAVTAHLNGAVAQVDLDPRVTRLTESQLAEEIQVMADVATKRATAVVHVMVVEMLVGQGMDLAEARDFVESNMPFATPHQSEQALSALSARYADRVEC